MYILPTLNFFSISVALFLNDTSVLHHGLMRLILLYLKLSEMGKTVEQTKLLNCFGH